MRVTLLLLTLLVCAAIILGAVPQQISYQGRLTSATNTPISGSKNLTFKIYTGAGAVLWNSGAVAVICTDGLFSVNLGASPQPALPSSIFTDTAATLGVTVESDPELTPRTRLTSNAFSYVTASAPDYLPLAGGTMTGDLFWNWPGNKVWVANNSGQSEVRVVVAPGAVGSLGAGYLSLMNYVGSSRVWLTSEQIDGGTISITNPANTLGVALKASGTGGSLVLYDQVGDTTVKLLNYTSAMTRGTGLRLSSKGESEKAVLMADSAQGGYLALFDPAGTLRDFFKPAIGETNTTLPDSAIGAREIADEPGSAFYFGSGNVLLTTTMQDLATVTITIPASGVIMLSGKVCEIDLAGTTGENWAVMQIDETAGGTSNSPYAAAVGGGSFPDAVWHAFTASTQRAYFKDAGGTYTFRLEALRGPASNPAGTARAFHPTLTAVYYPSVYGTATMPVPPAEAGQFERATRIASSESSGTGMSSAGMYEVDLRELELKAAKARADAEKAERELLQAQLNQQTNR